MTTQEFGRVLEYLRAAYPRQELHRRTPHVYFEDLKSFDAKQVSAAARRHVRTSMWFPSVAELLVLIRSIRLCVRCGTKRAPSWQELADGWTCGPCLPCLPAANRLGQTDIRDAVREIMAKITKGKK